MRRWPGRIEKPRSTHTSPAHESRRRAWSGASQVASSYANTYNMNTQYGPQIVPMQQRAQRPLSWHPSSQQASMYTSSPMAMATPDAARSSYQEYSQPIYATNYPGYDLPDLYVPSGQLSTTSTSPIGYPDASPAWQTTPDHQALLLINQQQMYHQFQPNMNVWQLPSYPIQQQIKPIQQDYHNYPHINMYDENVVIEDSDDDDDGEVLVGLGLYDEAPETTQIIPVLKLAETWQPPPSTGSLSDGEDNDPDDVEPQSSASVLGGNF